ncbi:helix-turn-helix domain-containing protein [Streptomyces bambusae]|uniref:Helix-turn-helix domain-containing protein n=2 Tax=Streptomyces bambusae TaxID=1550616 RepID=A0ABS6Z6H8_9ACTN|nr:helix-turn-helix domain-containing protein [Streptomyces bambusae]
MEVLAHGDEVGLTRLAADAALPKATAHRLLGQLVALGAVQSRSGRYRLGARTFRLGQAWHPARALRAAAARPLRELSVTSGGLSLSLSVPEGGHTVVVGNVRGAADDRYPLHPGAVLPPGNAAELVLTAYTPEAGPPANWAVSAWIREAARIRERGLAFEHGRCVSTLSWVAAPVFSATGQVVAAVAATGTDRAQVTRLGEAVTRTAALITTNLTRLPGAAAAWSSAAGVGPGAGSGRAIAAAAGPVATGGGETA